MPDFKTDGYRRKSEILKGMIQGQFESTVKTAHLYRTLTEEARKDERRYLKERMGRAAGGLGPITRVSLALRDRREMRLAKMMQKERMELGLDVDRMPLVPFEHISARSVEDFKLLRESPILQKPPNKSYRYLRGVRGRWKRDGDAGGKKAPGQSADASERIGHGVPAPGQDIHDGDRPHGDGSPGALRRVFSDLRGLLGRAVRYLSARIRRIFASEKMDAFLEKLNELKGMGGYINPRYYNDPVDIPPQYHDGISAFTLPKTAGKSVSGQSDPKGIAKPDSLTETAMGRFKEASAAARRLLAGRRPSALTDKQFKEITGLFKSEKPEERAAAIIITAARKAKECLKDMLRLAEDESSIVRSAAFLAMHNFRDKETVEALLRMRVSLYSEADREAVDKFLCEIRFRPGGQDLLYDAIEGIMGGEEFLLQKEMNSPIYRRTIDTIEWILGVDQEAFYDRMSWSGGRNLWWIVPGRASATFSLEWAGYDSSQNPFIAMDGLLYPDIRNVVELKKISGDHEREIMGLLSEKGKVEIAERYGRRFDDISVSEIVNLLYNPFSNLYNPFSDWYGPEVRAYARRIFIRNLSRAERKGFEQMEGKPLKELGDHILGELLGDHLRERYSGAFGNERLDREVRKAFRDFSHIGRSAPASEGRAPDMVSRYAAASPWIHVRSQVDALVRETRFLKRAVKTEKESLVRSLTDEAKREIAEETNKDIDDLTIEELKGFVERHQGKGGSGAADGTDNGGEKA